MQNVLKNLLSLILSQRNGYKLREKKMRFAMGSSTKNPYQRQSYIKHDSRTERSDNHALHSYKCIVFLFDFVIAKWIIFMWVNWNIKIEFIYIFFIPQWSNNHNYQWVTCTLPEAHYWTRGRGGCVPAGLVSTRPPQSTSLHVWPVSCLTSKSLKIFESTLYKSYVLWLPFLGNKP